MGIVVAYGFADKFTLLRKHFPCSDKTSLSIHLVFPLPRSNTWLRNNLLMLLIKIFLHIIFCTCGCLMIGATVYPCELYKVHQCASSLCFYWYFTAVFYAHVLNIAALFLRISFQHHLPFFIALINMCGKKEGADIRKFRKVIS